MRENLRPPFRADQVGSLLRPGKLLEARAKAKAGEITAEELGKVQDDAIREAVKKQEALGLKAVTDGEFRRDYWHLDFFWRLDGIEPWRAQRGSDFATSEQPPLARVVEKVRWRSGIFTEHFAALNGFTACTAKQTIPGPAMIHLRAGREAVDPAVYPDLEEFWLDLTRAYRAEIAGLYERGCRYLQIDDVSFAHLCDPKIRDGMRGRGDEPDKLLQLYCGLINAVISDRPDDLVVTTHICRGNFRSTWAAQGGYEPVAEAVFGSLAVDGFFLEYDSERAGDFAPLRFVPRDKVAVLGLITTKTPTLESKDVIKRRIDEATSYLSIEQLCLSPQCGFASTHHGNAITEDDQWRKLALVVETADQIWG